MRASIVGMGCVTPLGATPEEVWDAVRAGKCVTAVEILHPETGRKFKGAPVPPQYTAHLAREARLRRSSTISLLAATAAKAAMQASGLAVPGEGGAGLAIVFAVSSGGVQYTRRFYEQVVKQGANAASPMLFPETVYNAPASHVAAMLGVDGATYTLVGDGTVGLQALAFGAQLLELGDAEQALVVAAEELDWILLEAHQNWRLTAGEKRRGALLAEGAAAVLISKASGPLSVDVREGRSFVSRQEAAYAIDSVLADYAQAGPIDFIVSGGNDTWADRLLSDASRKTGAAKDAPSIMPKRHFGEALGAGALLQVVLAAAALNETKANRALVTSLGWNQQAAAALVERSR